MQGAWQLEITIYASSFEGVKEVAKQALTQIAAASSFKRLPLGWGGGGGADSIGVGCMIKCHSPVEARVEALRREADELEATLRDGPRETEEAARRG